MNFKTGDKVIYLTGINGIKIETVAHATKTLCYLVGSTQKYRQPTGELVGYYGGISRPTIRHPKPGEIERIEKEEELTRKTTPVFEKLLIVRQLFSKNALSYRLDEIERMEKLVNELERLVKK